MKYREALIAWNPDTDQIRVGPLLKRGDPDWTEYPIYYDFTGGAAETARRSLEGLEAALAMFIDFNTIVVRDRVPVEAAHREFLKIEEYCQRISPDTPGLPREYQYGGWL
jgi:hypothetical protein